MSCGRCWRAPCTGEIRALELFARALKKSARRYAGEYAGLRNVMRAILAVPLRERLCGTSGKTTRAPGTEQKRYTSAYAGLRAEVLGRNRGLSGIRALA